MHTDLQDSSTQGERIAPYASASRTRLAAAFIIVVSVNLSWAHQTILYPVTSLATYYGFLSRAPFIYRILPALLYWCVSLGRGALPTGLPLAPLKSGYEIFQLVLDSVCLSVSFLYLFRIACFLNRETPRDVLFLFTTVCFVGLIAFGYFFVPSKGYFYTYDFPDFCFTAVLIYYSLTLRGAQEWLLLPLFLLGGLNKETAIFFCGVYLIARAERGAAMLQTGSLCGAVLLCFAASRYLTVRALGAQGSSGLAAGAGMYEPHLAYTLLQLRNPVFLFALLNVCSYLYLAVYAVRRRFDRTDLLLLSMIGLWFAIMAAVGNVRELRLFVDAGLLMFVIACRHLDELARQVSPGLCAYASRHARR